MKISKYFINFVCTFKAGSRLASHHVSSVNGTLYRDREISVNVISTFLFNASIIK